MFSNLLEHDDWELLTLSHEQDKTKQIIGMILAFKGNNSYHPMLVGIDYDFKLVTPFYH